MEKPIIGITTGDLNGVGLETIIKVLSDNRMLEFCTPVVFGSNKAINFYRKLLPDHELKFASIKSFEAINPKLVNIFNCWEEEVAINPGELTDLAGKYAVRSLQVATQCLKEGLIQGIVTAPIHKKNTQSADFNFTGHTPFFKETFEAKDVVMMLYAEDFRVALITEHLPIAEVSKQLTQELIVSRINIIKESLQKDFGIDIPKIAVLGLNPHAGDNGLIGKEEEQIIKPAMDRLQQKGVHVFGPYSADGFFAHAQQQKFDVVVAMYHDQGLIPFKSLAGSEGVNYTCGLPIVRTSPDHGTAFDIAGKGIASPDSLREAIYQAISILQQREAYAAYTANPLKRNHIAKER
ncbi:4-hydroxythreonine-4-phosphate dehydrogenase PdxA [Taibaiella sp. KBW10]|uniref:4-hydroxythreonine-4-phosphate dehydrogenase PdxA n=1 Tax=Taibaiella sp. KBW10 TaxID=2153357 RepID=UPI000F599D53|nr:4-hydroxythreonine-4-phosphate dehydrogenase PdxA [Taibaiella sp. KBW10]RQO32307.1 4-hydroxythreonine-4-phosphate dehydrogenase PdxA [Taibaiella sp. KBW10]